MEDYTPCSCLGCTEWKQEHGVTPYEQYLQSLK